ncbi:MAG: hypothetical protein ACXVA9_04090 [Bdellovibrionales bacterium]
MFKHLPALCLFLAIGQFVAPAWAADSSTEKSLRILELLDLRGQKFPAGTRYPEFTGYDYEYLFPLAAKINTHMQAWIDDALASRQVLTPALKRSGQEVVNERINSALANKTDLFDSQKTLQYEVNSLSYRRMIETLDYAFGILGLSKSAIYRSDKFPRFNGLLIYNLMIEAYLHADHSVFVNPYSFFNLYTGMKRDKVTQPMGDGTGISYGPEALTFIIEEFFERYSDCMSEHYISEMTKRNSPGSLVHADVKAKVLSSTAETLALVDSYKAVVLFLGHGSKSQFGDIQSVLKNVDEIVGQMNRAFGVGKWIADFGGDSFNPEKPDIGYVMRHLSDLHIPVLAIQSDVIVGWGGVDKYIDFVQYVPTTYAPELDAARKKKVVWGGFVDGKPAGPTAVYLGPDFISGEKPRLKSVVLLGGGPIALEEAQYAHAHNVPVIYVRSEAKFPEINGKYGTVDEWAQTCAERLTKNK